MFLQIPPSFLAFHIPLIFGLYQLKMSEMCTLFQPIKTVIIKELTGSQWKLYENQPKSEDL